MRWRSLVPDIMLDLRSVRGRSILAGLALLLLLAGVAGVSLWRARSDRAERNSLENRASAVTALESARAQIFLTGDLTVIAVFADDPKPLVDQYQQSHAATTEALQEARNKLAAVGGPDEAAQLDDVGAKVEQLLQDADGILASFLTMSKDERQAAAQQGEQQLWPSASSAIVELQQLAQEQEAKSSTEKETADSASKNTLALLIAFSVAAFLTACAALSMLHMSITRPLTALRASARAVTSGDLEARATESGPTEVASVARDFNEMTQALLNRTERLVQSEQQFRDVLDISRDLVYKLNLETRTYDYVSPSASELLGFTPEEVAAMGLEGIRERFHPEDRERFRTFPRDLPSNSGEQRTAPTIEYRWKCKDGEYRWFSDNRAIVRDGSGKVLAVVGTVRDITSRRQAEEALRQSEEKFRSLSASAPVGIFSTDPRGKFIYVNEHLLETYGLRLEETLGRAWTKNIHPDDRQATFEEALKAGREMRRFSWEYRVVTPGGEIRWIRTVSSPILSRDGSLVSYVGAAEDITEHKRIEEDKRTAHDNTVTLLAVAAEARDPYTESHLQRIRGFSAAIASELGLGAEETREIALASLLHDLGKMRVPDAILTKPGPLSAEEWEIMRRHPIWGEELLPSHSWFSLARQVARWHHENWDGTGYPDGLQGEEIPIAAAITAVADGFDAMTTQRPYKGAWPQSRAIKEIKQNKGLRYSPEVVEAFERALQKGEIKRVATSSPPSSSDLAKAA